MADGTPPRQMSLVPYTSDNREIVLRRGSAVVVYDAASRQLSVRDVPDNALELTECPYCHRPLHDDFEPSEDDDRRGRFRETQAPSAGRSFVNPEYFGMLAQSQRPSPSVSGAGTPIVAARQLFQPALRSGRSRVVSESDPPTGAEFVASEPVPSVGQKISSSAFSPGYFKQFFREESELGRGGNGVVLLVEHVLDGVSLGHFACKRVPVGDDHTWLEKVLVEVKLLAQVPHKNLVKYHWVWVEEHKVSTFGPSVPCVWILQEFCNGGDLHNYVLGAKASVHSTAENLKARHRRHSKGDVTPPDGARRQSRLTLEEIFSFFRDITSGLHHLHSKGYIHRDLKPSNCLLQQSDGRTRVLISDFGEVQAAGATRGNTGATGTISYCAPEVLRQDLTGKSFGDFTTKSDIFSLGMIVYFMCFARLPYVNADDVDEVNEDLDLLRAEITAWPGFDDTSRARNDLPDRLYKFLRRLLSVDPTERPSTEEILTSIKAGAGLGDMGHTGLGLDDTTSRVTSVESPGPKHPRHNRRKSALISRPGLSSLGRHASSETVRRSPSPSKQHPDMELRHRSTSRPHTPEASSVVLRPRKLDPVTATASPPRQQSPILMLPPPPPMSQPALVASRLLRTARDKNTILAFRAILFVLKLLTITLPCSPFAPRLWVMYPLLGLAALDLGVLEFDLWRSIVFVGVHCMVLASAQRTGGLCEIIEGGRFVWEAI